MIWTVAFWLVVLFLTNSMMGLIRALVDKRWYEARVARHGVVPNRQRLVMTKAITLSTGAVMMFWLGTKAGYL